MQLIVDKKVTSNIMKHTTLILLLVLMTISCQKPNTTESESLKSEIEKLKTENKQLKISLSQLDEQDLKYRTLVGIPDGKIEVGKKNRIVFLLHSWKEIPKFDIYRIDGDKEIKIGSNNRTTFDYEFNPKSKDDRNLKVKVKIPYKGKVFEIPGEMNVPIE
jgi:hypothetical protein